MRGAHLKLQHHVCPVTAQRADVIEDERRDDVYAIAFVCHNARLKQADTKISYAEPSRVGEACFPTWFS